MLTVRFNAGINPNQSAFEKEQISSDVPVIFQCSRRDVRACISDAHLMLHHTGSASLATVPLRAAPHLQHGIFLCPFLCHSIIPDRASCVRDWRPRLFFQNKIPTSILFFSQLQNVIYILFIYTMSTNVAE